jgi:hypothetical protein
MFMQRLSSSFVLTVAGLAVSACASLGPEAKVTMVKEELKTTKAVGKVFIASPFGAADESGSLDKAVAATAMKAYGKRSVPATVINKSLKSAGGPDGLGDALVAPYAAKFSEALKDYDPKDPKTRPTEMELPSAEAKGLELPKKFDQKALKAVMSNLKGEGEAVKAVGSAVASGDSDGMIAALGKSQNLSALLVQAMQSLLGASDADHILLTQVAGTEADYKGGKKVKLLAALVNVKTGKFRYFGEIEGTQSMGLPYALFLGNMANKLFGAGTENDPALASAPPAGGSDDAEEAAAEEGGDKKKGKKKGAKGKKSKKKTS